MDELYSKELKLRVEADDPAALFEYSNLIAESDPEGSRKYLLLSAQLGYPQAVECVGDMHVREGNLEEAEHCYKACAKLGNLECAVKLLSIRLGNVAEETNALRELEELAVSGVPSAAVALSEYYAKLNNKKQAAYWRSVAE